MLSESPIRHILDHHNPLVIALQVAEKPDQIQVLHSRQSPDLALELRPQVVVVDALLGALDGHEGAVVESTSVDGAEAALSDLEIGGKVLGGLVDLRHAEPHTSNLLLLLLRTSSSCVSAAAVAQSFA